MMRYAFEALQLHRLEAAIVPRNTASRRVAEKLGLRDEGIAVRFLQIQGVYEDHVRYAITAEEWRGARAHELVADASSPLTRLERSRRALEPALAERPGLAFDLGRDARPRSRVATAPRAASP